MPVEYIWLTGILSHKPAGNVLAPPDLGNILPAFTPDRVWVGHWFLTPDYAERSKLYTSLSRNPEQIEALENLLRQQQIRYLVLPTSRAKPIEAHLASGIAEREMFGRLVLLTLNLTG